MKPTFDHNNFEESFSSWEFDVNRYERDNNTQLPDQIKIAILLNETKGPLQQHLQLNASPAPTYNDVRLVIMEYYRATTAFNRLQQTASSSVATNFGGGAAPMDIGAINKGKGKWKGKGKSKGKKGNKGKTSHKGKGKGYGQQYKGKGHIGYAPVPYNPFAGKGYNTGKKGKATGNGKGKGKAPTQGCYKCGQPGHIAKDCRVAVYNLQEVDNNEWNQDATTYWYGHQSTFDSNWWTDDQTQVQAVQQQQQQLALPPPQQADPTTTIHVGAINAPSRNHQQGISTTGKPATSHTQPGVSLNNELMIDSGAATHICPPWFAASTPTYPLHPQETPNLRTATEDKIDVTGYKWVYMTNTSNQPIVIPFYVCSVTQPILSVTRLAEQGFTVQLSEQPTVSHPNGFGAKLNIREGTYFLPVKTTGVPDNYKLDVHETQEGIKATISPITLTPAGAQWVTHQHDIWTYNSQGYLVRVHKTKRRATYMPDQTCPVPTNKLEDYRRTIAHKDTGTTEDFEEALHNLDHSQRKKMLDTGHSVKRRNMVQGEGKRKATTSSDHNTSNDDQAPTGSKSADTTGSDTTASKKTYWQAARKTARTSTKQRTAALLSHSGTHTERHTDNIRLLDTRRTFVEKSPRPSKNRPLHTTTDPGWTRCHQAHPRANNNGEANIWSKRLQDWWWLDNKDKRLSQHSVDRIN